MDVVSATTLLESHNTDIHLLWYGHRWDQTKINNQRHPNTLTVKRSAPPPPPNSRTVYKVGLSWLRSFNICNRMLQLFYQYVVASTVIFAVMCWGADFKAKDANRLNKLIKKAGSVVGPSLSPWKWWQWGGGVEQKWRSCFNTKSLGNNLQVMIQEAISLWHLEL